MGEPALNPAVLEALKELPDKYDAPGLLPCVSTVAPKGSEKFFQDLKNIKDSNYNNGRFQLQFSVHTTDDEKRKELIPIEKWSLQQIADFGHDWMEPGDRKVTLNFALAQNSPLDVKVIREIFDPQTFLIKLTPINPTSRAEENKLITVIDPDDPASGEPIVKEFRKEGFEVILSIGEVEENKIGSNCGMYLNK
jgi:23S rRNA (adenine2503-C2)-methyltransferase